MYLITGFILIVKRYKMTNIKKIRKLTNCIFSFIYLTPLKKYFLWFISRFPFSYFTKYVWVNTSDYYLQSCGDFCKKLKKAHISFKNKNILEIGSGSSIGWGYIFVLLGAKNYTSSDKNRSANMSQKSVKEEKKLIKKLEKKYRKKILGNYVKLQDNKIILITKKLNFKVLDITADKLKTKLKYDLIISNAVFEHLPKEKVDKTIKNMRNLLKKNGLMFHQIDLRDHFNLNRQFNFYEYSGKEWLNLTNRSFFYTNRLRQSDYASLFIKNGFKIIYKKTKMSKINIKKLREKIDKTFLRYSDRELRTIDLTIALKKL